MINNYVVIDKEGKVKFTLHDIIGKSIAILGIRGSGKTNTAAVLAEEILKNKLPVLIVDPDSEYWSLREKYDVLIIGKSRHADIKLDKLDKLYVIGEYSLKNNLSVIVDISEYRTSEILKGLYSLFDKIWSLSFNIRRPYFIVLEEAHEFIPQFKNTELKEVLSRIALRGRKRGLSIILISQRSAKVDKDVLTQSEILFLHKVIHPADLKVYSEILPLKYSDVLSLISKLSVGQCIVYRDGLINIVKVRLRETFHPGFTPPPSELKRTKRMEVIYKELIKLLKSAEPTKSPDTSKHLEEKIRKLIRENEELKRKLIEKDEEINKLKAKIDELRNELKRFNIKIAYPLNQDEKPYLHSLLEQFEKAYLNNRRGFKRVKEYLKILAKVYPSGITSKELAILAGKSVSSIYNSNLKDLIELGIIEKRRIGRKVYLVLNDKNLRKYVNMVA